MSIAQRMQARKEDASIKDNVRNKLYKEERSYRADKLVEAWSRVPEIGAGLKNLTLQEARNCAINLDRQATFMSRLTEAQTSNAFNGFTPENMLRLIRMAMPNVIRNKVFTEFAMESSRDSIKYFRPVFTKNQKGTNKMARRSNDGYYGDAGHGEDPFEMDKSTYDETMNDFNGDNYRKALYESTEDRFVQEFANATIITAANATAAVAVKIAGKTYNLPALTTGETYIVFGKLAADTNPCEFDLGYINGYVTVFGKSEQDVIATQNKKTKGFFVNSTEYSGAAITVAADADGKSVAGAFKLAAGGAKLPEVIKAYGRYDSESDFDGDYLGEIEIKMSDYEFKPRPTAIGVTWSQLAEISLDTSFSVSVEEYLISYASQEIRVALDYRAIKLAYHNALTNPKGYIVTFDAGWDKAAATTPTKEGYIANAQTFQTAIFKVADVMLNDIKRGGVSRLVSGPSAGSYCTLMKDYDAKGRQDPIGPHQFGELAGLPLFKVPSDIIPTNRMLCVWKNDTNDADVAIAFGTLVPFFSTGLIQRKNFYKEAALATFGDYAVLNKRYLSIIQIDNLKETTDVA